MLARQVVYHFSPFSSPFCFSYFSDRVSHFCLGGADLDPPIYTCQVAGIQAHPVMPSFSG
jgi:hypothetical protein